LISKLEEESPLGENSPRLTKSASNLLTLTEGLEFTCITATKKGFILGGTKGIIGFYEIEKSLTITNALSYQCPNPEDCNVISLSTNQGDSITSVVTANLTDGIKRFFFS